MKGKTFLEILSLEQHSRNNIFLRGFLAENMLSLLVLRLSNRSEAPHIATYMACTRYKTADARLSCMKGETILFGQELPRKYKNLIWFHYKLQCNIALVIRIMWCTITLGGRYNRILSKKVVKFRTQLSVIPHILNYIDTEHLWLK